MKRFSSVFLLLAFMALPALRLGAQNGGEIIRAEYGADNYWSDVTPRVMSFMRGDSLNFHVDNVTLGGDPAPGRVKTLRLQVQERNGANQLLVFRENENVNLRGYRGVNGPASDLRIFGAIYGDGRRSVDVTNRLNSQIRNGQLSLQVTGDTMGGDPARGRPKTLTVRYALNGNPGQVVVNEGDFLNLPDRRDDRRGDRRDELQITRAQYGAGNRGMDVTARLNSQIRNGRLELQVTGDTMGGDPARRQPKTLSVQYTFNGRPDQVVVNEGDYLRLPERRERGLQITSARYGAGNRTMDVTARLNSQIRNGRLELQVNGATMGGDPARRQPKTLTVQYVVNGRSAQAVINEGDFLRLPQGDRSNGRSGSRFLVIPRGAQLAIRTNEPIDSRNAREGQRFSAITAADVRDESGRTAIPRGSDVVLVIRNTAGSDFVLDIDSLVAEGEQYSVSTEDLERVGRQGIGANQRTVEMVGGGAAIGAIIGAIAGGGKGAAIGAGVGAAAGAGAQVLTQGKEVRVPAETVLTFVLDADLRLESGR